MLRNFKTKSPAGPSSGVELKPLQAGAKNENNDGDAPEVVHLVDESTYWWAWITAAWLSGLALPLLLFPRLVLFLAIPQGTPIHQNRDTLTSLEQYLAIQVGIGLIAIALGLVTSIPPPPSLPVTTKIARHPLLVSLSTGLCLTSFISYNTESIGALSTIIAIGSGFTGLWGMWVIMFEGSSLISKKTGADKRTSAFLFNSNASASHQKKLWKKDGGKDNGKNQEWEMDPLRKS